MPGDSAGPPALHTHAPSLLDACVGPPAGSPALEYTYWLNSEAFEKCFLSLVDRTCRFKMSMHPLRKRSRLRRSLFECNLRRRDAPTFSCRPSLRVISLLGSPRRWTGKRLGSNGVLCRNDISLSFLALMMIELRWMPSHLCCLNKNVNGNVHNSTNLASGRSILVMCTNLCFSIFPGVQVSSEVEQFITAKLQPEIELYDFAHEVKGITILPVVHHPTPAPSKPSSFPWGAS